MTVISQIYNERLNTVMARMDDVRSQVVNPSELFSNIYKERIGSLSLEAETAASSQSASQGLTGDMAGLIASMSGLGMDSSGYMSVLNALALRQVSDALTAQTALLSPSTQEDAEVEVEEPLAVQVSTPTVTPDGLPALNLPVTEYDVLIRQAADTYSLPEYLIKGVVQTESSFRSGAVSSAGAEGLMQLMPGTARMLGVTDSFDPAQNIDGGSKYLRQLIDRYEGDVRMALAAYNCGPGRVAEMTAGAIPGEEYMSIASSVRGYVDNVINNARSFAI